MNENELINDMISLLKEKLEKEYKEGETKRDAHPKSLGFLKAEFIVDKNLDENLKVGIFKNPKTYKALIRTSNSMSSDDSRKDVRGFAIKLLDVEGERFNLDEKNTQDFLFLSTETIPLGTVELFHDSIFYAVKKNIALLGFKFIATGKGKILLELAKARRFDSSPLDIKYFSTTPYKFGDRNVKYAIFPTSKYKSEIPKKKTKNYLTQNMQTHLDNSDASFDFYVQFQTNKETMPTEDASIPWDSPFVKMATIKIPKQKFETKERIELAENLSFAPAHALKIHKPIGGLNRARIKIYEEMSKFRHKRNNKKMIEPTVSDYEKIV